MAERKKTGGREKGVPNKRTAERATVMAMVKVTPLEYMLGVLNDETAEPKERAWAAKEAAPYVHAKLASIDVGNKPGEVFRVGLLADDAGLL